MIENTVMKCEQYNRIGCAHSEISFRVSPENLTISLSSNQLHINILLNLKRFLFYRGENLGNF